MSHYIGTGTVNISVNVPLDERDVIGKAAFRKGLSIGSYMKRLVLLGMAVDDPARADELREVRKRYYGVLLTALFFAALCCGAINDVRRTRTTIRPQEEEIT